MGIFKDVKVQTIGKEAARALSEGRSVFVARLEGGFLSRNMSGSVSGVAEMIESIEAEGWRLEHLSSAGSDDSHLLAMFRSAR
ncbi:MAG: hypothetical protein M3R38_11355 [Actinomycetota bacterium]|nr:hypothetical protein [Actinomycetota bacterium]